MQIILRNCTVSILGDSYSTFEGFIPETNYTFYPSKAIDDVLSVEDTWWQLLIRKRKMRLLINDSSSGTTVSTSVRPEHKTEDAFVIRMNKYFTSQGVKGEKPNCIILFGGTNDDWRTVPLGKLIFENWTDELLKSFLPSYCYMLDTIIKCNPQATIIAVLNTDMKESTAKGIRSACSHYGIPCVILHDISKKHGHPDRLGMKQIAEQIDEMMLRLEAESSYLLFPV